MKTEVYNNQDPGKNSSKNRKNRFKIGCLLSLVILLVLYAISIFPLAVDLWKTYLMRVFPKQFTHPLPVDTVDYFCDLLSISEVDNRCIGTETYSYEFFPEIRQRYPKLTDPDIVDVEIGKFLAYCDDPVESFSDGIHRKCYYDLLGDGQFTISIDYFGGPNNPDEFKGLVWSICTYAVGSKSFYMNYVCNPPLTCGFKPCK